MIAYESPDFKLELKGATYLLTDKTNDNKTSIRGEQANEIDKTLPAITTDSDFHSQIVNRYAW